MMQEVAATSFAALDGQRREQAAARFAVLRLHLEEGVPLTRAAGQAGVSIRTAERWLARYCQGGLSSLARQTRRDAGTRRSPANLVALVEGMALKRPRSSAAAIHRHRAEAPNALWQADHTLLDLLILDEAGKPARPWLTTVWWTTTLAPLPDTAYSSARRAC